MNEREKYLFDLQGFVIVRDFLTSEEVARLNAAFDANRDKRGEDGNSNTGNSTTLAAPGARGTEPGGLNAARPPGALGARGVVERDQHARQPRRLSLLSSFAHESHRSSRMTSLLRGELRATATGKALSTLFL